jgi:catechol 2,3-dioxygenase-like lactoylglutathione lyase family enzyme
MSIKGIDHIALPTADAERLLAFYEAHSFSTAQVDEWRAGTTSIFSIVCGDQKINVHPEAMVARRSNPAYLRGNTAEPGCADVCVVWDGGLTALLELLSINGTSVIAGPVRRVGGRAGGTSQGVSIYVRDPTTTCSSSSRTTPPASKPQRR